MNNPTEDEKKALALARRRERERERRQDPAYREQKQERERARYAQDSEYRARVLQRGRKTRADSTYKARHAKWARERLKNNPDKLEQQRKRCREWVREKCKDVEYVSRLRARARDLRYGLEPGQWDAEFARLRGICPICTERMTRPAPGVKVTRHTAATDHDHGTKKFRGILCRHCNLKENSDSAKAIAEHKRALAYHRRVGHDVDAPTQGTLL